MRPDRAAEPAHWYSTNLVGVATPVLASAAFNAHPVPLRIAGTREAHAGLFALLERSADLSEAQDMFGHYLEIAFGLRPAPPEACLAEQRRWRASYIELLQGWGLDANSGSGAVLKGWVESRFGLVPTFHRDPLGHFPSPAWIRYLEEKAASRYHNNCIQQQLDLLYEFCQWMLMRFELLGAGPWATLWRGSTRCDEQIVEGSLRARQCTVRLNNLVSFSRSETEAQCFGDWVFKARVPLAKLLLVPGLLNTTSLHGEAEVLAIGGDYEVEARYD